MCGDMQPDLRQHPVAPSSWALLLADLSVRSVCKWLGSTMEIKFNGHAESKKGYLGVEHVNTYGYTQAPSSE